MQVVGGVDPEFAAGFDYAVDDGAGLAGVGAAEKQEVLFADGGGANGVFDEVVVDFQLAVFQIAGEALPAGQCVADRFAEGAFGQLALFFPVKDCFDVVEDGRGFLLSNGGAVELGLFPKFGFDAVEFCDEAYDFARDGVGGFRKFPARMRPTAGVDDCFSFSSMFRFVQPARVCAASVTPFGQVNRPCSSRLIITHIPVPSQ